MNRMHGIIFAYGKCAKLQTLVEQRVADSIPLCRPLPYH